MELFALKEWAYRTLWRVQNTTPNSVLYNSTVQKKIPRVLSIAEPGSPNKLHFLCTLTMQK